MSINVVLLGLLGETGIGIEELYNCFKNNDKFNVTLVCFKKK